LGSVAAYSDICDILPINVFGNKISCFPDAVFYSVMAITMTINSSAASLKFILCSKKAFGEIGKNKAYCGKFV
jgi:hypothetical protein